MHGSRLLIWALVGLAGCTTYGAETLTLKSPDTYSTHAKESGLNVGAEAYDTPGKAVQYLGEDVSGSFTPIVVALENGSKDKFIVERNSARLSCANGTTLRPVSSAMMYGEYRHDVGGAAFVGGVAGAASASDANDAMKSDWAEKAFPEQLMLGSSHRTGGFLYFRGTCGVGRRILRFTADRLKGDAVTIEMEIDDRGRGADAEEDQSERGKTKDKTSGLALGAGIGYQTPLLGLMAAYYVQLGNGYRIAPYVGFGNFPTDKLSPWGYALGVMGVLGKGRHRFVLDLSYGMAGVATQTDSTVFPPATSSKAVYGVTAAVGYEYMHGSGFFVRPLMWGYTGLTSEHAGAPGGTITFQLIAAGFKFW